MTQSESDLLVAVADDLDVLGGLDPHTDRESMLARLHSIRDELDTADQTSPIVHWLVLEHQVGGIALVAIGANKTATNLPRVWRAWVHRTRVRVSECQTTDGHSHDLAAWTDQAREYTEDSLKLIRDLA